MSEVLGGLSVNGKPIVVGASDENIEVPPNLMLLGRKSIMGWSSVTSIDSQDTRSFSVHSGLSSINQVFPLERTPEAFELMMNGKARFRCVPTTGN
jgi:D-arabinose 1-dehydrogenase-like Zn-dependent alcohol dehydrogenase